MEKLFTVHVNYWLGGGNFYITENKTGRRVGVLFGSLRKRVIELINENANDAFDYVFDVPGEPNPIPTFVDHYELKLYGCDMGVVAHLTEKGCLRKSLEIGGGQQKYKITPYFPMDYL